MDAASHAQQSYMIAYLMCNYYLCNMILSEAAMINFYTVLVNINIDYIIVISLFHSLKLTIIFRILN
jgi:hypothetical protein